MRRYEAVVILDPDMPDEDIGQLTERYSQLIKKSGGEVIKIEDWGSRRLAYVVKKKEKGHYVLLDFVGQPELLSELERQFKIAEEVMKFLSVKLDDNVDLGAFQAQAEKQEQPPATEAAQPPAVSETPAEAAETQAPPPADDTAPGVTQEAADAPAADDHPSAEKPEQPAIEATPSGSEEQPAAVQAEPEGGR